MDTFNMLFKINVLESRKITQIIFVFLMVFMYSLKMPFQICCKAKTFFTNVALMWFELFMNNCNVLLKSKFFPKDISQTRHFRDSSLKWNDSWDLALLQMTCCNSGSWTVYLCNNWVCFQSGQCYQNTEKSWHANWCLECNFILHIWLEQIHGLTTDKFISPNKLLNYDSSIYWWFLFNVYCEVL